MRSRSIIPAPSRFLRSSNGILRPGLRSYAAIPEVEESLLSGCFFTSISSQPIAHPKTSYYASKAEAYRPLRQRIEITTALAQTRAISPIQALSGWDKVLDGDMIDGPVEFFKPPPGPVEDFSRTNGDE